MAKFFVKRGPDPARVVDEVRASARVSSAKPLAVIMRGVVAIGPVKKPSLHCRAVEQPVFGGVPDDVLQVNLVNGARISDVRLDGFAQ